MRRGNNRFADKEGITDDELKEAVKLLEANQADANLSGGVYRVRVARSGEGKSGGYRVIVFFKSDAYEATHLGAVSLYETGAISEKEMKEFDEMCLVHENEPAYKTEKSVEPLVQVMEHITA